MITGPLPTLRGHIVLICAVLINNTEPSLGMNMFLLYITKLTIAQNHPSELPLSMNMGLLYDKNNTQERIMAYIHRYDIK